MNKNIQEKIIDITGIELSPGNPAACLGNGERGFECCCDECECFCRWGFHRCFVICSNFDLSGAGGRGRRGDACLRRRAF